MTMILFRNRRTCMGRVGVLVLSVFPHGFANRRGKTRRVHRLRVTSRCESLFPLHARVANKSVRHPELPERVANYNCTREAHPRTLITVVHQSVWRPSERASERASPAISGPRCSRFARESSLASLIIATRRGAKIDPSISNERRGLLLSNSRGYL